LKSAYPVIFIVGPTCTGKSEISFLLAQKIDAEIIYCDSVVVYKEVDILSAKPSLEYRAAIPHHMIDRLSVSDEYNVSMYSQDVQRTIEDIRRREKNVIITGGSGMYMKALLDGIFEGVEKDPELRDKIEARIAEKGLQSLYQRLKEVDPGAAERISGNDKKRIVRALEVYELTGSPISQLRKQSEGIMRQYPYRLFGIMADRGVLYQRIDRRAKKMFASGAVDEVRKLLSLPLSVTAAGILGVKEIKRYSNGECDLNEAEALLAKNTRNYAKRQMTWFRKEKRIEWITATDASAKTIVEKIYKLVSRS